MSSVFPSVERRRPATSSHAIGREISVPITGFKYSRRRPTAARTYPFSKQSLTISRRPSAPDASRTSAARSADRVLPTRCFPWIRRSGWPRRSESGRSVQGNAGKLPPMNPSCPRCQGLVESSLHGRLFVDRCSACGWEQSGTANSPEWVRGYAVEVEREFWVRVSLRLPLTPAHLRAVRAVDPGIAAESAQSFVARIKRAEELRLGPFWPRPRALAALQTLADAGFDATMEA